MNTGIARGAWPSLAGLLLVVCLLSSCGVSLMPTKDVWFTQHYYIMQDFERQAYRTLSETGRQGFQELFWKYRSDDARKLFEERLQFVQTNFKKENSQQPWNTDRARVYLLNGSPASIDYDQNVDFAMTILPGQSRSVSTDRSNEDIQANRAEIWTYPYDKYLIKYVFVFVQPSTWRMVQTSLTNNRYLGEFDDAGKIEGFKITDLEAYKQEIGRLEKRK
jgi:GWxTD domain-containing protein